MQCIRMRALKEWKTCIYWKHECESPWQTFLDRLKNAVFYYGTLVGEQWRALPMYISLGKEHDVDCLSTEVNSQSSIIVADPATSRAIWCCSSAWARSTKRFASALT